MIHRGFQAIARPDDSDSLAAALGAIEGLKLRRSVPLGRFTTLRIGGPAELLAEVEHEAALVALVRAAESRSAPLFLLGLGSNVLIPDEGLSGVTVRLAGEFRETRREGLRVDAGGAVPLARLAQEMARRGLVGLEALSGFPSSVGGAVYMNAGAYGTEIKDLLVEARVVGRGGEVLVLGVEELEPAYRSTALQGTGAIVTRATLLLRAGDSQGSLARIQELNRKRWASLPSGKPNAGSIFRNPPGEYAGRLMEQARLKGATRGAAAISDKHANVIVNHGGAKAADVLELMVLARIEVRRRFGVELEPEIVLAGGLRRQFEERAAVESH